MVEHDHIGGEKATRDYVLTLKVPLKATGGGVRGSKNMLDYFQRSHGEEWDAKNRIKKYYS